MLIHTVLKRCNHYNLQKKPDVHSWIISDSQKRFTENKISLVEVNYNYGLL